MMDLGRCFSIFTFAPLDFYGTQEKPLNPRADVMTAESLHYFDQTPFDGNASNARGLVGLGPSGLVYVPKACAANRTSCALHLFLHLSVEW